MNLQVPEPFSPAAALQHYWLGTAGALDAQFLKDFLHKALADSVLLTRGIPPQLVNDEVRQMLPVEYRNCSAGTALSILYAEQPGVPLFAHACALALDDLDTSGKDSWSSRMPDDEQYLFEQTESDQDED